jgi:hypothetical protein
MHSVRHWEFSLNVGRSVIVLVFQPCDMFTSVSPMFPFAHKPKRPEMAKSRKTLMFHLLWTDDESGTFSMGSLLERKG